MPPESPSSILHSREAPAALRVAFLVPEDRRTGTYFRYHNLARALRELGHSVTVYSQSSKHRLRGARETRDDVPYVLSPTVPGNRVLMAPVNPLNVARRLFTSVEPADVYHLFQPFPTAACTWLALQRNRPGLFAYDWDDFWINDDFGLKRPRGLNARWSAFCLGRLERSLPGRSALATVISRPLRDLARSLGARRIELLPNGIWPRSRTPREEARRRLGLRPDAVYAGKMGWSGEIDWCLEALRRCQDQFPGLRLALCGQDPGARIARIPEVAGRVDYLGVLSDEDTLLFNDAIDLALLPLADSEFNRYRLPYKLTEHMAGGVPVLCSNVGDAGRLATEFPGILCCQPTLDRWSLAFRNAVAAIAQGSPPAPAPAASVLERFSWLKIASNLVRHYGEALHAPRSAFIRPSIPVKAAH